MFPNLELCRSHFINYWAISFLLILNRLKERLEKRHNTFFCYLYFDLGILGFQIKKQAKFKLPIMSMKKLHFVSKSSNDEH